MHRSVALALLLLPVAASAQNASFHPGPVFPDIAPVATIRSDVPVPAGAVLKAVYDVTAAAAPGSRSTSFDTAARFLNSHVESGVPEQNIRIAYVVHGKAITDLLKPERYAARTGGKVNASAATVARLQQHGVAFLVCGQAAAAMGVTNDDLLPGVKMAISASSAHVLLGMQGFTLVPF
jgi:intracellular sulfur oxidation DsrE/DsrF family protein